MLRSCVLPHNTIKSILIKPNIVLEPVFVIIIQFGQTFFLVLYENRLRLRLNTLVSQELFQFFSITCGVMYLLCQIHLDCT